MPLTTKDSIGRECSPTSSFFFDDRRRLNNPSMQPSLIPQHRRTIRYYLGWHCACTTADRHHWGYAIGAEMSPLGLMNGPDALEMRCPLLSRKQTSIGRRRKVGFLYLIPALCITNQPHRSASPSRERFDHPHPPPLVLNADARKSVNCDEPNRNRRTTIAIHLTSDAAALTSHRKPGCAGGRASAETDFAARITSANTGAPASMRNSAWIIFDCRPESVSNCST